MSKSHWIMLLAAVFILSIGACTTTHKPAGSNKKKKKSKCGTCPAWGKNTFHTNPYFEEVNV
jgi:hypothetical protein